jgi:formyltetrahydrofolate synthetase
MTYLASLADGQLGRLVLALVTALSPIPLGSDKTTTPIGRTPWTTAPGLPAQVRDGSGVWHLCGASGGGTARSCQ